MGKVRRTIEWAGLTLKRCIGGWATSIGGRTVIFRKVDPPWNQRWIAVVQYHGILPGTEASTLRESVTRAIQEMGPCE